MPSNDERRKVAARLRKANLAEGAEDIQEIQRFDYVTAVRFVMWPNLVSVLFRGKPIVSMHEIIERLADLIEPEPERTCQIVNKYEGTASTHLRMLGHCSKCGEVIEVTHKFCFECGAKVVDK